MIFRPTPLVRIPEPFDHPDWLFEVKHDGFRALAHVDGDRCRLVSRNGHEFSKWDVLKVEIAHRAISAVLDGEIVCLDRDGRSNFYRLMFRRATGRTSTVSTGSRSTARIFGSCRSSNASAG